MSTRERAVFCFTVYEKGDQKESRTILTRVVSVAAAGDACFDRFMAYIETPKKSPARMKIENDLQIGDSVGSIAYIKESEVNGLLGQKMADEDKARRQPGHQSYKPSAILSTNTCVIVIGSRSFCGSIANIHMIEIRELQRKLNQILTRLLGLSVSQRQATLTREDLLMVPVNQDPKEWLTYNVRWAYDNMQRLSEIVDVSTFAPLDEARSFRSIE